MVSDSLAQIRAWLAANAPRILELSLSDPASDFEILKLKGVINKELPKDYIDLYEAHNGINSDINWGNFFYGLSFFSVDEIIADQEFRVKISEEYPAIPFKNFDPEIDGSNFNNPNWIGLGTDGSRCSLRLDLSPSPKGKYGQIIFIDLDFHAALLIADNVTNLLDNFSKNLNKGLYKLEPDALEDGHHFLDPDIKIDIVNWRNIGRWKDFQ